MSSAGKEDTTDINRASGEATNGENTGKPDQARGDSGQQKGKCSKVSNINCRSQWPGQTTQTQSGLRLKKWSDLGFLYLVF